MWVGEPDYKWPCHSLTTTTKIAPTAFFGLTHRSYCKDLIVRKRPLGPCCTWGRLGSGILDNVWWQWTQQGTFLWKIYSGQNRAPWKMKENRRRNKTRFVCWEKHWPPLLQIGGRFLSGILLKKYMLWQLLINFRISALVIFLKFHFRTVPKN